MAASCCTRPVTWRWSVARLASRLALQASRLSPASIRSALVEGARWWAQAFDGAGFVDAFRVEVLPQGVSPLDARYNVINWVHRQTRGWSYGFPVTDPRTGEIVKGSVLLGSLRVRQDKMIFEGLVGADKSGTGAQDDPIRISLARLRQLAVHETGHALGFAHNSAGSTYGDRASMMDYRPGRSAIDAIRTARQRCWRADWVLDIDVKGFFDSIDHELLLRAVRKHTKCSWALLYIDRWLKAPARLKGGELVAREQGTPQGGVISPLLANLFLHYAFDAWVGRAVPGVTFERYADDIICHCRSEREARELWRVVGERFATCGLVLHPQKTKLVYCKDTNRTGEHDCISCDFLGYTFRPRLARWRGGLYGVSFLPAASPTALKAIRRAVRKWGLQRRSDKGLFDIARMFNPYIRGWIGYFSHFYKSALYPTLVRIDAHVLRWVARKFKRFKARPRGARAWLVQVIRALPRLFAHWPLLYGRGRMLGAV